MKRDQSGAVRFRKRRDRVIISEPSKLTGRGGKRGERQLLMNLPGENSGRNPFFSQKCAHGFKNLNHASDVGKGEELHYHQGTSRQEGKGRAASTPPRGLYVRQ